MTREELEKAMGNEPKIQASFEGIGDDVKFVKLIVNGKEKVISIEELENTLSEPCDCISREEVCDYIAEFVNHEYATDREHEMVENIISGIQHLPSIQPTTKENLVVGDCISRKSIKHKLQEHHDFFVNAYGGFSNLPQNDKSRVDEITNCIAMVVNEPPVIPKPKTGYWILQPSNKEQGERDFIWWKCSECGQVIYSETEQDRQEYHAYCGRCGAKILPTDSEKE